MTSNLAMFVFIAWRNIWRYPIRSLLTVFALAGGLIIVILYSVLLEGMTRQMVTYATDMSTGHLQLHRRAFIDDQDLYATLPWSYLNAAETALPAASVAPRLYAAGLASAQASSTGVLIKAVDAAREPRATRLLDSVRSGTAELGPASDSTDGLPRANVVVGTQLAKNLKLQVDSELILVTQAADGSIGNGLFRVAAILKPVDTAFDRTGVLMSIDTYQSLMSLDSGFHELAVKTPDAENLGTGQALLQQTLERLAREQPLDELGGAAVVRNWREINPTISDMLKLSQSMVVVIGFIVVSLASLGMLNTMLMAVHERTHEFGILLAIGMKSRWLMVMVLIESFLLALISAAIGAALGTWLGRYLQTHGIDFSGTMPDGYDWAGMSFEPVMRGYLDPGHVVNACLIMTLVAMLSSLLPSWRTVRLKPAEVMR
ncbi:ABC transporter permease [Exilibacterium tricleocarpae]|uniref:ABC transporter permease n=1 Tax=Exilibacterium tricleocarpae TaxID=2591008 RepID=A0A545TNL5_9GAMM|nr:FtsX-like permease family protein [Exilibacterium tricleocarpae]TQV78817.1 ABC transporter permease [Exilibacterium tricleocarpae]